MKIRERILLGFIVVISIMMIVDINSMMSNIKIIRQVDRLELSKRTELTESYRIAYLLQSVKSNVRELLLEAGVNERMDELQRATMVLDRVVPEMKDSLKILNGATQLDHDTEELQHLEREVDELKQVRRLNELTPRFLIGVETVIGLVKTDALDRADDHFETVTEPIAREIEDIVFEVVQQAENEVRWALRTLNEEIQEAIKLGIYLMILSFLLAIGIGLLIARSISNPLLKLVQGADAFGRGELDTKVQLNTQGELQLLANAFNEMAAELKLKIESINQINSELNESNQTKDAFFSIIAHDLRNPFNAILGYSFMLSQNYDEFDEAERRKFISEIDRSSRVTFELLENLLHWARTQSGKIEIRKEWMVLARVVDQSFHAVLSNANDKHISLVSQVPDELKAYMDVNTMQVVLNNLISNAVKFTKKDGKVLVTTEDQGEILRIIVQDNGVGMSPEVIHTLLHEDRQVSTDGTDNESGTGLGLVLVKDFLRRNGASLQIESRVNFGSKFIITLPNHELKH